MEESTIIAGLVALIGAFGIKEVWNIWKKKIDISAAKEIREEEKEDKEWRAEGKLLAKVIEENKECAVKLARMEERLTANVASSGRRSATKKTK